MDTDELRKAANYIIFAMVDTTDKNMAQEISGKLNHAAYEIDRLRDAILSASGASTLDGVKNILDELIEADIAQEANCSLKAMNQLMNIEDK